MAKSEGSLIERNDDRLKIKIYTTLTDSTYVLFGDQLERHTLVGAVVIIASGLYTFWSESSEHGVVVGRQ